MNEDIGEFTVGRSWAFWLGFAVIAALLVWHRPTMRVDPQLAMQPDRGYRSAVDLLVERGCLALGASEDGSRRIVEVAPGEDCPAPDNMSRYLRASPLGADMQGLLGERWVIDDVVDERGTRTERLAGIRPNTHELRFSGTQEQLWNGSVFFAEGARASLQTGSLWTNGLALSAARRDCPTGWRVDGESKEELGGVGEGQFVWCDGNLLQKVEPIQALSETEGSARRVRYPALAGVLVRLEAPDVSGNVTSTIRADLQNSMQRALQAHLERADTSGKDERTIRAGILLMDGLTGEIAAAATMPLLDEHLGDRRNANWLDKNWNFERLEVGSTAKVPFAAAILEAHPRLGDMSPARPSTDFCQGNRLCIDRASDNVPTSFETFIAISSNGHALWLFDRAYRSGDPRWQDNLRKFACIEPLSGDGDPSCSGYLWRTDAPGAGGTRRGTAEPMLRLAMDEPGGEGLWNGVYLDILGANRSRWTSANLAQAYARIFANRQVNPRLTRHDAEDIAPLGISGTTWRRVTNGMAQVLTAGNGTARDLCAAINCDGNRWGQRVWLYAKTGTSTIDDVAPDETGEGDNGKILVLLAATTSDGRAPADGGRNLASLRIMVITQRYQGAGHNPVDLAKRLFNAPEYGAFRNYLSPRLNR